MIAAHGVVELDWLGMISLALSAGDHPRSRPPVTCDGLIRIPVRRKIKPLKLLVTALVR